LPGLDAAGDDHSAQLVKHVVGKHTPGRLTECGEPVGHDIL
jgi:hypothetical protein